MLYSIVVDVVVVVVIQHALHLKCTFTLVIQDALKAGRFITLPVPVTRSLTNVVRGSAPR